MSQVSIVDIEHNNPQIPTRFNANVGFAIPIANTLEIYGATVPAGIVPVYTTGSGNNITTNVQRSQAIAASDATKVGLAAFDSSSFGVDANGFVTFTGSTFDGLTPDDGAQVTPVANNINVYGQKALVAPVMQTHNVGGNFLIENRSWETQYVVDASTTVGLQGTFTTIQAAINQAVSDGASLTVQKKIYIRYGNYVENLSIPPGIFLIGESLFGNPGALPLYTQITGNHTLQPTNIFKCTDLWFQNPSPTLDSFTNAGTVNIIIANGCIFQSSSSGLVFTLNFGQSWFNHCNFNAPPFQTGLVVTASGMTFENCFMNQIGIDNQGQISFYNTMLVGPIACTGGQITAQNANFTGDSYCINGTGSSCHLTNCTFSVNSATALQYSGLLYLYGCSSVGGTSGAGLFDMSGPRSFVTGMAGNIYGTRESTGNTSLTEDDFVIAITDTSAPRTVTLENAAVVNRSWFVKDYTGGAATNNITVVVSGGVNTIDGLTSYVISENWGAAQFVNDGTGNYFILSEVKASAPSANSAILTAYLSSTQNNVTGDGTVYTIPFNTVLVDTASAYNSGTGVFTAPFTGNYLFNATVNLDGLDIAHTEGIFSFNGSVYESRFARYNMGAMSTAGTFQQSGSVQIPMTAGDTMSVFAFANSGTKTVDVIGAAAPAIYTNFSAYYLG